MTQVSINPNTRNVVGDDRALFLKQLEEQDPNGFKALNSLVFDLNDAQEYVDNQPVKDLTNRKDPGQSDTNLSGDITPSFSGGSGVSAGSGRNLLLDFFFKTPQGLAMGVEDLVSMAGIANEFLTMSPSQRYGYQGQAWHNKYTKPAVEAVKKLAPVAAKGYMSYLSPSLENLPERAEFGGLVSDIASGIKEGVHERGAASLVEPLDLAFPIAGKTSRVLSGKSTALSPKELREHYWDDTPDVVNRRVRERANRREDLFYEQQIEEDFYNRFEALKSELAQGMGKDITNWKEDVDLPVEIEAANYKKGGAYEAEWKGSRSVEDIEGDLDRAYEEWREDLGVRGLKDRMPRPIGELAKESLFKQMPEGYRSYYEDNARYKELDNEQRRLINMPYPRNPFNPKIEQSHAKKLDSIQNEMGALGQRISEYPESFRDIESVENRLQVLNAKIWDAENEIGEAMIYNNPADMWDTGENQLALDNLQATLDGLEVERNELLQQKMAFPEIQKEVLARIEELGTYDKETLAVIDRALDQGFYAVGYHASKGDIRFFDEDLRQKGTGGGDSRDGFFFASNPATSKSGLYTQSTLRGELLDRRSDVKYLLEDLDQQATDAKYKKNDIKRDIQKTLLNNYLEDIDYTNLDKSTKNIINFLDRDLDTQANIRAKVDDIATYRKAADWPKYIDDVEQNLHWFFRSFRTDRDNVKPNSLTAVELKKLGLTYDEVKNSGISFTASEEILADKFNVDFERLASVSDSYDYSMWVGGKEIEIPEKVITTMESLDWLGFDNPIEALNVAFDMRHTQLDRSIIYNYDLKPAPFPGSISDETVEHLRNLAVNFSNTSAKLEDIRHLRTKGTDIESVPLSKGLKNIFPRPGSLSEYGGISVVTSWKTKEGLSSRGAITASNIASKTGEYPDWYMAYPLGSFQPFTAEQIKDNLNYFINEMDAYRALPNRSPVDFEGVPIFNQQVDGTITPISLVKFPGRTVAFIEKLNAWRVLSPEQKDKFADLLAAQYNESAKVTMGIDNQLDDELIDALRSGVQGKALPDIPSYKDADGLVTAAWTNSPHPFVVQSRKGYVPPELLVSYKEAAQSTDHINRSRIWAEVNAGTNTTKARLHIEDPYILDMKGGDYDQQRYKDAISAAKQDGNDAVIVRNVTDGGNVAGDVYIVFKSDQIRSATAMYDPIDAPVRKGVLKEYEAKYNKLRDENTALMREALELNNQMSRQANLGLDDDFSAINSKLKSLNYELRSNGNARWEMYGLKNGITQKDLDILIFKRYRKYQEFDRLKEEIRLAQSEMKSGSFSGIFDSDEMVSEHDIKLKALQENIQSYIDLKSELGLADGSILGFEDEIVRTPGLLEIPDEDRWTFPNDMLPTKDVMASWGGIAIPLGVGGAAHTWLVNNAEAQQELETELVPDDELTADIGNILDTFDIPGLDSPEAKENFILRNKDWGYRISEKDKKRSKDLQKIHLWRTKELGGNDL
jgi:hypothetical protein